MQTITVRTPTKIYPVHIGAGLLGHLMDLPGVPYPKAVMLVTDSHVQTLYAQRVTEVLTEAGIVVRTFAFPAGEESKNLAVYGQLLEALAAAGLTRQDVIVALGGGVTGDLAGYAAATYLRGIRFVQLPTTLLAAVDSSVGGKTGVNLGVGKNLVGAFWQPEVVICDTDTLHTLPAPRIADGLAEMLKHGMIAHSELFAQILDTTLQLPSFPEGETPLPTSACDAIAALIARNVEIKAAVVGADEREHGTRALLNFGHTVGHAIEKRSDYALTHGHAVALGMLAVTRAAQRHDLCGNITPLLEHALTASGLPTVCPYPIAELLPIMCSDKKRAMDGITLVLPRRIGQCYLQKFPLDGLGEFFAMNN
ncbi:MAG: 3-dehydroquinate synthase [Oscillospiraceae bacterium]|jgi:3-dehydroquinate synthase|nr:3-dehydroquinate synthase [Oscillospiraceae bacterium]